MGVLGCIMSFNEKENQMKLVQNYVVTVINTNPVSGRTHPMPPLVQSESIEHATKKIKEYYKNLGFDITVTAISVSGGPVLM